MARRFFSVFLAVLMALSFSYLTWQIAEDADAVYLTRFSNDCTEKTITFLGSGTDETTSVTVEKGSVLTHATMTVKGEPDNSGNYPLNVSVDVGGDGKKEWKFQGIGYGTLGKQTYFNDSSIKKTVRFGPTGTNTDWAILLPKDAQVTSSTIDINRGEPKQNYGFRISGLNGQYNSAYILSSDCANPFSPYGNCWPKLEVDCGGLQIFQPGSSAKDAQTYVNSASTNYGSYTYLMTNYGATTYGFAEFDLSTLPPTESVTSATVYFFHHYNANNGQSLEVREVLAPWQENTITWTNQPACSTNVLDTCVMSQQGEWLDFDVTQTVSDWHTSIPPLNPAMDIGNDGDLEYSHSGELNSVETTQDLSVELNSLIQGLPVDFTDDYGNDFVKIPIKLTSAASGSTVSITNITIDYTFEADITVNPDSGDLLTEFNNYIPPGEGNVAIPIHVKTASAGKVTLGNLNLTYDAKPKFQSEIPNLDLPEDTHAPMLYDISSHFHDDFDTPSTLSYEVIYDTNELKGVCMVKVVDTYLDVDATLVPNWNSEDFPNSSYIAVKIKATDTNDRSVESNQFLITVTPQNDEPLPNLAQPLHDLTLSEDGLTSLDLTSEPYFYDIEGDILSYSVEVDPMDTYDGENITAVMSSNGNLMTIEGGQDFNGEGIPVWIFCDDDPDVNTTSDGLGNYVHREVLVDVEPVNDEPLWFDIPTLQVFEDTPQQDLLNIYEFAFDIETDSNDLDYTIERNTAGSFVGVEIDPNGYIDVVSLGENYYGTAELEILAADDEDEASGIVNIIVEPVNDNPTVSISDPRHDSLIRGVVAVRGNANDIENSQEAVEVRIDNGEWLTTQGFTVWSYQLDTTLYENGPHTIDVRSYDGELYSQVESVSVQIQNEPPIPPTITISYPQEGAQVKGTIQVQGTTTETSAPVTNVSIRMGLAKPWVNALGTQLWNFTLDTTQYTDGPLTIYVRAYDGLLFSDVVSRSVTVNNTVPDEEPPPVDPPVGKGSDSDAFPWWLVILIIVIAMVIILAMIFMKRKKDKEKEGADAASSPPMMVQQAPPTLRLASPVSPGFAGAPIQSFGTASQDQSMYGGYGQAGFSPSQPAYQQPEEPYYLQTTVDETLFLPQASITTPDTMDYGGPSSYETTQSPDQIGTPLLVPGLEDTAGTTVACFSCGGNVPVPEGATIITCPTCGTMGQL